ncbi:alpha/beta hydrolase [Actinomadura sp. LD22]|uniref:Alpha/beta hydrolase n=1 Tax=Actinomadura physcomitrii TaxID=2650748 RepID=A0A6I4M6U4_9ACTN|nr:alpha/beta fold hydrolase [Actinomadura physcomitrii]MWA00065.1 alpha/beta hydrolase [Actinomadura physcomitrii]
MILSPRGARDAAANAVQLARHGRIADLRPMPADPVEGGGDRCGVRRYRPPEGVVPAGPPVLFVPPPAAPARCYDLRRGCSLAEHVVRAGRRSYLLDRDPADSARSAGRGGRDGGLREWVRDLLPGAIRAVSRDAGGQPVQLVGWSLGGVVALLAAADDPALPIASVAAIAAPVDVRPPRSPVRLPVRLPAPRPGAVLERLRRATGIDRVLLRPYRTLTHLDNADFLAQIEAVEQFTGTVTGFTGNAARRIQRAIFQDNALAAGGLEIDGRRVELRRIGVPVLAIAGRGDAVAPVRSVLPLIRLLPGAPKVRFEVASGGHLDVLTGRSARATTWAYLDRWLDEGTVRHGIRRQRRGPAVTV